MQWMTELEHWLLFTYDSVLLATLYREFLTSYVSVQIVVSNVSFFFSSKFVFAFDNKITRPCLNTLCWERFIVNLDFNQ